MRSKKRNTGMIVTTNGVAGARSAAMKDGTTVGIGKTTAMKKRAAAGIGIVAANGAAGIPANAMNVES